MVPATVMGEATQHVRQQWEPHEGERLYGLGQHQQGLLDIKGTDLELRQYNGEIVIPLLVSSRGYGILWDNTSLTRFGRTEPPALGGDPGDGERRRRLDEDIHRWRDGEYELRTYSSGEHPGRRRLRPASRPASHGRQEVGGRTSNTGGRAGCPARTSRSLSCRLVRASKLRFRWKSGHRRQDRALLNQADHADGTDVALVGGRRRRRLLVHLRPGARSRRRRLSPHHGEAPMMPRWAFGLWQCRERYRTAAESVDGARRVSQARHPVDVIVQDWQYWGPPSGARTCSTRRAFPIRRAGCATSTTQHARLMISVWPKFYPRHRQLQGARRGAARSTSRTSSKASRTG